MTQTDSEKSYAMHGGKELELMLAGRKPMAVFYRAVTENFDETDGQPFHKYVKSGEMNRKIFYIQNIESSIKLIYYVYTIIGQEWRADIYKSVKKAGQKLWCKDLEIMEGLLLGYSIFENNIHINSMYGDS
jgi:hypothetical protein